MHKQRELKDLNNTSVMHDSRVKRYNHITGSTA